MGRQLARQHQRLGRARRPPDPPEVNATTAQKHDYPSAAHRRSYARRSAAERSNATIKDLVSTDIAQGRCRVMGLVPMSVFIAAALEPKTRRRQRRTVNDLVRAVPTAAAHPTAPP